MLLIIHLCKASHQMIHNEPQVICQGHCERCGVVGRGLRETCWGPETPKPTATDLESAVTSRSSLMSP